MTTIRLPSLEIPESQKRGYSEADVHSKLFDLDMTKAFGYPSRLTTEADGEHFREQRTLAVRRLKTGAATGRFDGLYLIGNSPVVLCEIKRYEAIDASGEFEKAKQQLVAYARSDDFAEPPPFLVLYCGKPERTRFFVGKTVADPSLLGNLEYDELTEIWEWKRVREFQLRGSFAQEVVTRDRLREILLYHLDRIEDSIRAQVVQAIQLVTSDEPPAVLGPFGKWLLERPQARERMRQLHARKVAETGKTKAEQVAAEMVTQAALNYLNKVFFLNLCEDRLLPGFYRIMREFLPTSRTDTTPATAAVFLGLLRRRIQDSSGTWDPGDESAYRQLRQELAPDIQEHVIEQNSWRELMQVAFDLAAEEFPLVFREDAYDYFRPERDVLAELIYDLSTKSFRALTNQHVGDIYQGLLSARRTQQSKLGAFYTPAGDVDYMVSKLGLTADAKVLDPCMGSGHFLEGIVEQLVAAYRERGIDGQQAYTQIVEKQLYGGDIDSFALSLAAIRLFLLGEGSPRTRPHLYVHDMLLHSPERAGKLFTEAERIVGVDPEVDDEGAIDRIEFDAVVGNPPYGARKPEYKKKLYERLYPESNRDTYAMFFQNGIERLREGGRLCLITNDSFRTLTTHARLRRHILDRCKILEILLTDTKHFEGLNFRFAGMAITTLERCSDADERAANMMRLVDYIREPKDFWEPGDRLSELRQEEFEAFPETPFFVGVPREVFEAARNSLRVRDVANGRQGLITADDGRFLAPIDDPRVVAVGVASDLDDDERASGIAPGKPYWVPFAKGEGFGEFWRGPGIVIDWSHEAVAELRRRDRLPAGTSRRPRLQNREHYFREGLTYTVVSKARLSVRLMPEGWIFSDKGSAIFPRDETTDRMFLLGYLNSMLATYFMKRIINTTTTAHLGYIEKLPYRRPDEATKKVVVDRSEQIVRLLQGDPGADIASLRAEIDEKIFDLFEIRESREDVRHFYRTLDRVEDDQAANE